MHRIDTDGNVTNLFNDNGPGNSTVVDDEWLNAVQEELCNLLVACGVTLVKGTWTQLRDACVSAATANKIMRRDANGRAKVANPSTTDDIDTMGARDTAIATHAAITSTHGAASAATPSRIVIRDAAGRAKFADPSANDDADTKGARDTAIAASTSGHATATAVGTHGSASAATPSTLMHRDSNGRSKIATPVAIDDVARYDTVTGVRDGLIFFANVATVQAPDWSASGGGVKVHRTYNGSTTESFITMINFQVTKGAAGGSKMFQLPALHAPANTVRFAGVRWNPGTGYTAVALDVGIDGSVNYDGPAASQNDIIFGHVVYSRGF